MHKSPVSRSCSNHFQEFQKKTFLLFDDLSHDLRHVKLVFIGNKIKFLFDAYREKQFISSHDRVHGFLHAVDAERSVIGRVRRGRYIEGKFEDGFAVPLLFFIHRKRVLTEDDAREENDASFVRIYVQQLCPAFFDAPG